MVDKRTLQSGTLYLGVPKLYGIATVHVLVWSCIIFHMSRDVILGAAIVKVTLFLSSAVDGSGVPPSYRILVTRTSCLSMLSSRRRKRPTCMTPLRTK